MTRNSKTKFYKIRCSNQVVLLFKLDYATKMLPKGPKLYVYWLGAPVTLYITYKNCRRKRRSYSWICTRKSLNSKLKSYYYISLAYAKNLKPNEYHTLSLENFDEILLHLITDNHIFPV